jgi:imidazolonepropionase-like amidohydrolase
VTDQPDRRVFIASRVANEAVDGWLVDHAVVVEGDRIASVVPKSSLPTDIKNTATVFDLGDVSLLPGLIDAHCHMHCSATIDAQERAMTEDVPRLTMRAVTAMRKALLAGTTTIRDLGTRNEVAFPVRDAVQSGVIPGPRMLLAGTPITITAGHCWFFGTEADSTEDVITAVRTQVRLGANVIKMMATGGMFTPTANPRRPQYPVETLAAAVSEAERMGVQIVAHTLSANGVQNCVEAGIHNLIHARWYDMDPDAELDYRPDVVKRMADQGQWVDPTIGHQLLGEEAKTQHGLAGAPIHWAVSAKEIPNSAHLELLNRMDEAGVRFTAGLDMGMVHAYHDLSAANAWAFVEWLGWSPWRAIYTATAGTAEGVRVGDIVGRIKPGMIADLAAFDGDPAQNIRHLNIASSVIQNGVPVKLDNRNLV